MSSKTPLLLPPRECFLSLRVMAKPSALALPLALGLLLTPACRAPRDADHEEVERLAAAHEAYLEAWHAEQLRFQRENMTPFQTDHGAAGTMIVQEAELVGRPGSEKLRVRFSFVNTSGVTMESATASLVVIDPIEEIEWGEVMTMRLPLGFDFAHGSSYSSFFDIPLRGVWRKPGWGWRLDLEHGPRRVPAGVRGG